VIGVTIKSEYYRATLFNHGIPSCISSANISVHLKEQRARKAALNSFIDAVVDWYDFLLYGIVAALIFKDQFFPSIDGNMGTLVAFATFGVCFYSDSIFNPVFSD